MADINAKIGMVEPTIAPPRVRRYRLRITHRACENFGAVDYTIFETITEIPGGLRVETQAAGICEGERFNDRPTVKDWPGCVLDSAHEYRIRHGYVEVGANDENEDA